MLRADAATTSRYRRARQLLQVQAVRSRSLKEAKRPHGWSSTSLVVVAAAGCRDWVRSIHPFGSREAPAVALKPKELDFTAVAALPLAGAAAFAAVEAIDPQPGQVVLVNGASGGVGSYASNS